MPVEVFFDEDCSPSFMAEFAYTFTEWIKVPANHIKNPEGIVFDRAVVLNDFHSTTSKYDPDATDNVTVILSNPELREKRQFYTLHWRKDGGSVILPKPDDIDAKNERRRLRKEKKARLRAKPQAAANAGEGSAGSV